MPKKPILSRKSRFQMSKAMFDLRKRAELRKNMDKLKFVKGEKVDVVEFEGRKIVRKTVKLQHPNLVVHIKTIKLIWNELVRIWRKREKEKKPQLYSARFFDLAAVEKDYAIYEHVSALTVEDLLETKFPSLEKVVAGYLQLEEDFFESYIEFVRTEKSVVRVKDSLFYIRPDFSPKNVLFEGFDKQGKPRFILMDVIREKLEKVISLKKD